MAAFDSQDIVLSITSNLGPDSVRASQDLPVSLQQATTAKARDSQDLPVSLQQATTAKARNSQDILLWIMKFLGARNSQEVVMPLIDVNSAAARLSQEVVLSFLRPDPTPVPVVNPCSSYYTSLVTSEYKETTKFLAWLQVPLKIICDIRACISSLNAAFDIDTALGAQLDILGQVVGESRTVGFQPSNGVSPVLDDATYRILLKAKIAQNQWNGQISSLYGIWAGLFPGGTIVFIDNQNMTASITLTGAFSSILQDLISNGYIVPRPETVLYSYFFTTLPIFGFDQDTVYVAGFDKGHLA